MEVMKMCIGIDTENGHNEMTLLHDKILDLQEKARLSYERAENRQNEVDAHFDQSVRLKVSKAKLFLAFKQKKVWADKVARRQKNYLAIQTLADKIEESAETFEHMSVINDVSKGMSKLSNGTNLEEIYDNIEDTSEMNTFLNEFNELQKSFRNSQQPEIDDEALEAELSQYLSSNKVDDYETQISENNFPPVPETVYVAQPMDGKQTSGYANLTSTGTF